MSATAEMDEQNYVFLKRLCQVLTALGSQLAFLWVRVFRCICIFPTFSWYDSGCL